MQIEMAEQVAIKKGLFSVDGATGPALLGGRCTACEQLHFPAQNTCPYCSAGSCMPVRLSDRGRLYLHTAVSNRPPGYRGAVPFGFGVVELADGLRVISRLTAADLSGLRAGLPVRLVVDPIHVDDDGREVLSYAFTPDGDTVPEVSSLPPAASPGGPKPAPTLPLGRPVEIAGVGIHPFGRFNEKSVVDIAVEAVQAAVTDAGIRRGGFQAAYCGTVYTGVAAGHKVLTALGMTGIPIVNIEAGCASGGAALIFGVEAIRSGRYDCVLVFGMEKMPRGIIRSSFFEPWREEAGLAATPAYFALRAQRLMRESGVTREHLAEVSVKNHRNGVHNPCAMFRKELSVDAVLNSPIVCDPLTLYMLCSPNEGAAALILRAARPSGSKQVTIAAAALRSHLPGSVLGEHTPMSGLRLEPPSPTELASYDVYEAAGVGPEDLDVVELQDTDSARELLSYEELGLCPRGESGKWIAEGKTELTGTLPVNPSGGLLSKGEPLGASGLGQVVELFRQLRDEAGPRQVRGARTALAHTVGRGANACVIILQR